MTFTEMLLPEFDEEMKSTRKMLERVPDGKFDFKPHAKSMSLGHLASHVAELPGWAAFTLDSEELDIQPGYKPEIAGSRKELLEKFDKAAGGSRAKIAAATDQQWNQIWTLKFAGKTIMSMPRKTVMRSTVLNHLIHHRAQLGVYLRLNEIPVPGMYGASADEDSFWEAKA